MLKDLSPMNPMFTYPKGVHSYMYFLQPMRTPNSLPPIHAYSPILLLATHAQNNYAIRPIGPWNT